MADQHEQSVVKPEVMLLESLLDDLAAGRLRVPRFQRPFVWERQQMLDLFDSIERGYPIGSVLVWDTTLKVPSLDTVAGIDIPSPPADGPVSYLLDGHQRLSTLLGTLGKRPVPPLPGGDAPWRIFRRLRDGDRAGVRFQHWEQEHDPPADLLPLQSVLRTMDFLTYARRLARSPETFDDAEILVDEAEELAQRIKSYKIAVVRLVGGGLSHAVEAFARLNSGGRLITAQDMVSALTYRPEAVDSLSDQIVRVQNGIAASGFGRLPTDVIFQTLVGLTDEEDVTDVRWSAFALGIGDRQDELIARAELALGRAVQFLRYEAGVPLASLLPYPLQAVLLAVCFDRTPYPSREQIRILVRWFWATSWSGTLRSAGNADFWAHLMTMRHGDSSIGLIEEEAGRARPFPVEFEPDRGRVRAFLLWEMREFGQRLGLDGAVIDPIDLYARSGPAAYRPALADSMTWSTANQVMLPTPLGVVVDVALRKLPARQMRELIVSHGIPIDALAHLHADDAEAFVSARSAFLTERELAFMAEMGVEPPVFFGQDT